MSAHVDLGRRSFLKAAGILTGGLVIGFRLAESAAAEAAAEAAAAWGRAEAAFEPDAYLQITPAGEVIIHVPWSELGQGPLTSVAMLVADELEADWRSVQVRRADTDPRFGQMVTGGSRSVRESWEPARRAGAAARLMLIGAAAARWGVPAGECRAQQGRVIHEPSGRRSGFGELAADAAAQPVPADVPLKEPAARTLIGRSLPRVDTPEKVTGRAGFGLDVRVPDMIHAAVARPPALGRTLRSFDASAVLSRPGVLDVKEISSGVAVLARSTYEAIAARDLLPVIWDPGPHESLDDDAVAALLAGADPAAAAVMRRDGDPQAAFAAAAGSDRLLEAAYELPFLSHSPLEPMNCTARIRDGKCEVWAPIQAVSWGQSFAARAAGLQPADVTVHPTYAGGGFGRRLMVDFVVEAVELARQTGKPVQVVWTREDDMRHGHYRPASRHVLRAALDAGGRPVAWSHHLASPSITAQLNPGAIADGKDEDAADGIVNLPYAIANLQALYSLVDTPVPVGWLRSVYNTQNALANECFLDEVARAGGRDPVALRLELLQPDSRLRATLAAASERWGWPAALPAGHGQGVACHACFGSFVTMMAEVSVAAAAAGRRRVRVHRVLAAVDCGPVVHPDGMRAQIEGGIAFALSGLLHEGVRLAGGRVVQGNYDDYPVLTMAEMPVVEVLSLPSEQAIGGIGEPGYPPLGPAVLNALYDAVGVRVRTLPLDRHFHG